MPTQAELEQQVLSLETALEQQELTQASELKGLQSSADELRKQLQMLEGLKFGLPGLSKFATKVEWTIEGVSAKIQSMTKGESIWSPHFNAGGLKDLQLEFYPKGREKTLDGFCSLFLWCPSGARIKYQLSVGSFLRAPDVDEYIGRIGHGHSNFCALASEIDNSNDLLRVGVHFLEVSTPTEVGIAGLQLSMQTPESMLEEASQIVSNRGVNKIVWKVSKMSEKLKGLPKGASLWSKAVAAAGVAEILLEFYPNGSKNTTKDGFCAFYIRCPYKVEMVVTLFVGKTQKGPIRTVFDNQSGKGLPDFCLLADEIDKAGDFVEVGLQLQQQVQKQ
eukprot:CAMPEP_0178414502 /NCGR_PEP_ID=MMETSP0689_2-20121128/23068_1 /TAXON_ID=160604 /ORGANISM="Amphidinium massartii, Strain CS-259" /LENGTH=333 /DNA_ID=CAMNT_0020035791 /DNA_START=33 /DNA_END=1031 /DNA_ORIENTATION=+